MDGRAKSVPEWHQDRGVSLRKKVRCWLRVDPMPTVGCRPSGRRSRADKAHGVTWAGRRLADSAEGYAIVAAPVLDHCGAFLPREVRSLSARKPSLCGSPKPSLGSTSRDPCRAAHPKRAGGNSFRPTSNGRADQSCAAPRPRSGLSADPTRGPTPLFHVSRRGDL